MLLHTIKMRVPKYIIEKSKEIIENLDFFKQFDENKKGCDL